MTEVMSKSKSALALGIAAVAVAASLPVFGASQFLLSVGTLTLITAIATASLHLIIRMGHVSLAHAAFMGIGAYASVVGAMQFGIPIAVCFVLAFALPAGVALLVGPVFLRLTGKYFVLGTFMLGEIVRLVFTDWKSVTNGAAGILGIPAPAPAFLDPVAYYYLALAAAAICVGTCARILGSEIGRAMDALREGEDLARCSGVPGPRLKVIVFAFACGLAGIAGALQAHFVRFIDPSSFSALQSLNLVVANVLGSLTNLTGTLIGTVFLFVLPELLRDFVEIQRILFGVVLIVVMAFVPGGLMEMGARVRQHLERKRV